MEHQNLLGVYIKERSAVAVLTDIHGQSRTAISCFSVSLDDQKTDNEGASAVNIGQLIAERVFERKISYANVAAAMDCSYYTQHKIHSRFTDHRQIAQTVKFDAEEVLASDVLEKAIAFDINSSDGTGSDITIYSSQKKDYANILNDLQTNKIDPVSMEPDVCCLTKFLLVNLKKPREQLADSLIILISGQRCYFIYFMDTKNSPVSRTFLTQTDDDKTKLLQRQIPLTLASFSKEISASKVFLFDTTNSVNVEKLDGLLGIKIEKHSIADFLPANFQTEGIDMLDAAIAAGAAISASGKAEGTDFRRDFSPYMGKRQNIERTLKFMSIIVSLLLLAVGIYFQIEVIKKGRDVGRAEEKLKNEVKLIMPKKQAGGAKETMSNILKREIVKLSEQKSGKLMLESGSVEAKLNFVLEAINSMPANIDLNIETIEISQNSMRLIGDTDSSQSTLKLFDAIKEHKELIIDERSSKTSSNRNDFRVTMRIAN